MGFVERHDGHRLTQGMLAYYTEQAFISPRPAESPGLRERKRGRPCNVFYSATDLILVRWMVRLAAQGLSLKKFGGALKFLRSRLPEALIGPRNLKFFVLDNNREVGVSIDGAAIQLTGNVGQVLLAFSMDLAVQTIDGLRSEALMAS